MTYRDNAAPEPLRCPRDQGVLELRDDLLPRLVCVVCDGVWLRVADAIALATRAETQAALAGSTDLQPAYLRDASRRLSCPGCHEPMDRFEYGEDSRVAVDACLRHGLWLDRLELAQVAAYLQFYARPVVATKGRPPGAVSLRGPGRAERLAPPAEREGALDTVVDTVDAFSWVALVASLFVD
jgi:hypothetical protein